MLERLTFRRANDCCCTRRRILTTSPALPFIRGWCSANSCAARAARSLPRPAASWSARQALYSRLEKLIAEGISAGDFRNVDPIQTVTSIIGTIVFYFISMPAQQFMHAGDPASPERIAARGAAVLDFICAAVFTPAAAQKVCKP